MNKYTKYTKTEYDIEINYYKTKRIVIQKNKLINLNVNKVNKRIKT